MPEDQSPSELHIDSDWKAEAQAEKERLAAQEKAQVDTGKGPRKPQELPEANFKTLVGVLASQALMGLGTMQDPDSKGVVVDLDGSRFGIDLLGVVEEKTKGNLTDDEDRELKQLLSELRARYTQIAKLVADQVAAGATGPGLGGFGTGPAPPPAQP